MKRPAEVISAVVGVVVALGIVTLDEGKIVSENAAVIIAAVGAVSGVVTAVVARRRGEATE